MPDRPAKTLFQSLVSGVNTKHNRSCAGSVDIAELRMRSFDPQPAVMLERDLLVLVHPLPPAAFICSSNVARTKRIEFSSF